MNQRLERLFWGEFSFSLDHYFYTDAPRKVNLVGSPGCDRLSGYGRSFRESRLHEP